MKTRMQKGSDNHYPRILLSSTIIIFITILILSTILYMNFEAISISLISGSIEDSLSQVSYSATYMRDMAKSLGLQVYFDNDISRLLYGSPDATEITLAFKRLNSYRSTAPYVHSIYIYNRKADRFYTNLPLGESKTRSNFFDQDIVERIENFKEYRSMFPIPRTIPNPSPLYENSNNSLYTFMIYDSPQSGQYLDEAIILNVSEDWLRNIINAMDASLGKNIFIIDSEGRMVIGDESNHMLTDLSGEEHIKKILSGSGPTGYFVSNVNKEKSLVTYVSSDVLDWKFISITPYQSIISRIQTLRYNTLLFAMFILFVGIFISFLSLRKINQSIRATLQKLNLFESEKRHNLQVLKQEFLKCLLTGTSITDTIAIQKKIAELEISLNVSGDYRILLIKIDRYNDFCNKYNIENRRLIKYGICNMASELSSSYFRSERIDMGNEYIALIINSSNMDQDACISNTCTLIQKLQDSVIEFEDMTVSVISSAVTKSITDLSTLYAKCCYGALHTIFYPYGCLLQTEAIDCLKEKDKEYAFPMEKFKILVDHLMLGKYKECINTYHEVIQGCQGYSYDIFHSTLSQLFFAINTSIYTIAKNNGLSLSGDMSAFNMEISRLEKIEDINENFGKLFESVSEKIRGKKSNKNQDLVNLVMDYIQKNYTNTNLSIDAIASEANIDMSPVYLGRIFKKLTLKSVGEYINEVRMDKAVKMLVNTSLSINEITEKVGFTNSIYFYSLFKKMFGMTPNLYRQTLKVDENQST